MRRRASIFRPFRVRRRARKPCLRFRFRCDGWYSAPYVVNRFWIPAPVGESDWIAGKVVVVVVATAAGLAVVVGEERSERSDVGRCPREKVDRPWCARAGVPARASGRMAVNAGVDVDVDAEAGAAEVEARGIDLARRMNVGARRGMADG